MEFGDGDGPANIARANLRKQRAIDETTKDREGEYIVRERSRVNRLQSIRGSSWSRSEGGEG